MPLYQEDNYVSGQGQIPGLYMGGYASNPNTQWELNDLDHYEYTPYGTDQEKDSATIVGFGEGLQTTIPPNYQMGQPPATVYNTNWTPHVEWGDFDISTVNEAGGYNIEQYGGAGQGRSHGAGHSFPDNEYLRPVPGITPVGEWGSHQAFWTEGVGDPMHGNQRLVDGQLEIYSSNLRNIEGDYQGTVGWVGLDSWQAEHERYHAPPVDIYDVPDEPDEPDLGDDTTTVPGDQTTDVTTPSDTLGEPQTPSVGGNNAPIYPSPRRMGKGGTSKRYMSGAAKVSWNPLAKRR